MSSKSNLPIQQTQGGPNQVITTATANTVRQFAQMVADQHHAMAGAVIAASAAQAVALGTACIQITLADQSDTDTSGHGVGQMMLEYRNKLLDWCDRDATAIAEFVALREAGELLTGQQLLCDAPAEMSRLAIEAVVILQDFRPFVSERVQDDLEMSITLLVGTAQSAMLLLDSNLRIWPDQALLNRYEPIRAKLERQIGQLSPVARIRN